MRYTPSRSGEGQWSQASNEGHPREENEGGWQPRWQRPRSSWKRPPAVRPKLPSDTEGSFAGWDKGLNVYTNRVEYKIAVVGVWIDPVDAQKSWGNLRAAVAQQNRLRAAQNQAYGSWQEGYSREPHAEEGDKEAGDPTGRRASGQHSQPHQGGNGQRTEGVAPNRRWRTTNPTRRHNRGYPTRRRSGRASS